MNQDLGTHLGTLYCYPLAVMGPVAFEPPIRLIPDEQAPEVLQEHRYKEI
jgi:hypothetical protein